MNKELLIFAGISLFLITTGIITAVYLNKIDTKKKNKQSSNGNDFVYNNIGARIYPGDTGYEDIVQGNTLMDKTRQ